MSGRSFLLTRNYETIRGDSTVLDVKQDADDYADVSRFGDLTVYIDIAEVTAPSGAATGLVLLSLESSATLDESGFLPVVGPIPLAATTTSLVVKTSSAARVPLGRVLRWRIVATIGAKWGTTMRIRVVGNRTTYFAPTQLDGCTLWFRADRGLTFASATPASIVGWADQSPTNDPNRNLTSGTSPPTLTLVDSQYNNQMTAAFSGGANCYMVNAGTWSPALQTPRTWVVVGHKTSSAATYYFMDGNSGGAADYVYVSSAGAITAGSGGTITSAAGHNWTAPSVGLYESNGASSKFFFNDFTTALMSGNPGSGNPYSLTLGAHAIFWGGGNNWPGTIAEVICFNALLSTSQKQLLKRYLTSRYAINIT